MKKKTSRYKTMPILRETVTKQWFKYNKERTNFNIINISY